MIYNKLVRDNIPQIIQRDNKKAIIEILDDAEYQNALNKKLQEELNEYLQSEDIEELADLVEVIFAILEFKQCSIDAFIKTKTIKLNEKGAFRNRIFLKEIIDI